MRLSSKNIVFSIFLLLKLCKGDEADNELPYDLPDSMAENIVCGAMDSSPSDMKINVTADIEYEDALKLMSWNIKNDFQAPSTLQYGADTDWKRPILDLIFYIFTRSCPAVYVPREFLSVIKELNLIYQNSIDNKIDNNAKWGKILEILTQCSQNVKGGDYTGRARMIEKISLQGQKGQFEVVRLLPPEEMADNSPQIDLIIDSMWFAFANTYGACYKKLDTQFNSASNIKKLFYQDFLKPLMPRWMEAGPGVDFGIMIGDFNIDHIILNMRHCVTGTFMKHGIMDRQLIRPVSLNMDNEGKNKLKNKKTGRAIFGK